MRLVKGLFGIVIGIFLLGLVAISPVALIGVGISIFGWYLMRQKRKGKQIPLKAGWVLTTGILLTFILAGMFGETDNEVKDVVENNHKSQVEEGTHKEKLAEEKANKQKERLASEEAEKEQREKEEAERLEKEKQEAQNAQQEKEELAKRFNLEAYMVARVVDGDTFVLSDGRKVRLIGVNTPESTTRTEVYGKEASIYTTENLNGKQVWLQKDVSETDRYGRLLRIVWLDIPTNDMDENEIRSKMFNAELVLNGYAEPSTYPPDVKYSEHFRKFAREAREAGTGLWAFGEEGTTKGDFDTKKDATNSSGSASAGGSTLGKTSTLPSASNGSSTSSTASSSHAAPASGTNTTDAPTSAVSGTRESYKNCTELRKVYPNGVPSDHPAYESKHDRDKDGWACER
ncbi:thermonuclease family protein [Bacillus sp. FJAT-29790]|uniref:thermonuclease family protein n=1 Tax=Bacillus sp. FJAT-29790 TaxID=1895002 RepID=UPI001C221C0C|nr:thermonuclease family protein [Bacillus sp. FJAT-29790]MBU8877970.1 thermonuclease family protein [Bacillus sp. FJAT-29790]